MILRSRRVQTYGTLIVDYETSKVVDMIPSRDTETVAQAERLS